MDDHDDRPYRPDRIRISTTIAVSLRDAIDEAAEADRMSRTEWIELTLRNEMRRRDRAARKRDR